MTGRLNIGHDVTSNRKYSESVIEGNRSYFDRHRGDTTNSFAAHLSLSYQRRFDKRGRRLKLSSSFDGSYGNGHGARIDTAGRGFSPSFLSNTATTGYFTPSMSFSWEEPLGKKHSLLFSISGKYNYSTQERLFLDILTGKPDCINTRFFTENRFNGTISATYAYGRENDGFSSRITLGVNDNLCMRNERLGDIPSANPNFIRPAVGLRIGYAAKGKSVLLTYSESESVPTTQQLRESLDDSNPMFLTAGNGNLKLPVNRTLALKSGIPVPEHSLNFTIMAQGHLGCNTISSKSIFFSEDTLLEKYSYTAPAGSSLTVPVNVNGDFSGFITTGLSRYFERSKLGLDIRLGWNINNTHSYIGEKKYAVMNNVLNLDANLNGNWKSTRLTLSHDIALGRLITDGSKIYDYMGNRIHANINQRICEKFELSCFWTWNSQVTTRKDASYQYNQLDCSASWLFGKDLLNSRNSISVSNTPYAVMRNYTNYLGRAFGLSFQYIFSKR